MARPRTKEKPVKITLYLDEKYRDMLVELADADRRSPSQFVELMIMGKANQSKKSPGADSVPAAVSPGSRNPSTAGLVVLETVSDVVEHFAASSARAAESPAPMRSSRRRSSSSRK